VLEGVICVGVVVVVAVVVAVVVVVLLVVVVGAFAARIDQEADAFAEPEGPDARTVKT
jgi:hypothetical protein